MKSNPSITETTIPTASKSSDETFAELEALVEQKRQKDALEAAALKGKGGKVIAHPKMNEPRRVQSPKAASAQQTSLPGLLAPVRGSANPSSKPTLPSPQDEPPTILSASGASLSAVSEESSELLLPRWHPDFRGVPNALLRSALFAAVRPAKSGQRLTLKNETLASVNGLEFIYSGEQLDQGDLDVLLCELHYGMLNNIPLGTPVLRSDLAILKMLGRGTGKKEYERLHSTHLRMVGSVVQLKHERYFYAGSIINRLHRDEKLRMSGPVFNPDLIALFQAGSFSSIHWEQRLALSGSPLAQWLHSHYSSHRQPYDYSVAKIHELCGSKSKNLRQFRYELKGVLPKLANVTQWRCEIITGDKLRVDKAGCATA